MSKGWGTKGMVLTIVALVAGALLAASASGTLQLSKHTIKVGNTPSGIAVADFNRDGRDDLAVTNFSSSGGTTSVSILAGKKGGKYKVVKTLPAPSQPDGIATGRFGKGKEEDLVVAGFSGAGELMLYQGGKGFKFSVPTQIALPDSPRAVAVADFNGDHRSDIAASSQTPPELNVLIAKEGGTTFKAPKVYPGVGTGDDLNVGRVNKDKRPDLVTTTNSGKLVVLLGAKGGKLKKRAYSVPGAGSFGATTADFDQDGNLDAAVVSSDSESRARGGSSFNVRVVLFAGSKSGKMKQRGQVKLKPKTSLFPQGLTAGTVDGDRDPDVVVSVVHHPTRANRGGGGTEKGSLIVLRGKHAFKFSSQRTFGYKGGAGPLAPIHHGRKDTIALAIQRFGKAGKLAFLSDK